MTKSATGSTVPLAALAVTLAVLHVPSAWAAANKVWVANNGTDSPTCGDTSSPCRAFPQALTNVAAGGEIGVLTPGDYQGGNTIIMKSVSITNDGAGEASLISPNGLDAVTINTGVGDIVSLRGLVMDGLGTGRHGVFIFNGSQGSALHIQNCVIRNFEGTTSASGIQFESTSNMQLFVSDTIIFNNGSVAGTGGIVLRPGNTVKVVLDRVHLENNVIGLRADGRVSSGNGARVVIRDSAVSGNASDGILAISQAGAGPAFILAEHTSSVYNLGIGIHANGPHATILLDDNVITQNGTGVLAEAGGQLISYGNNKNNNNIGPEGAPTGFYSQM